jgi:cyclic beta-1,2-glucan synthetase
LEWTTAAQGKSQAKGDLKDFYVGMGGSLCAVVLGATLVLSLGHSLEFENVQIFQTIVVVISLLWVAAPAYAFSISSAPKARVVRPLGPQERLLFRVTARRIWHFFSTFVTEKENFLPPDNYQIDPLPTIAHRSSPTNFGLYLISVLAAKDFGWIGMNESIDRLELTLKSMMDLQKYEGHFFNWYETTTRLPLEPRYISSVDNGNLTAHLFVVVQACVEILRESVETKNQYLGLFDAHHILDQAMMQYKLAHLDRGEHFKAMAQAFKDLSVNLTDSILMSDRREKPWEKLTIQATFLVRRARVFFEASPTVEGKEIFLWSQNLQTDILSLSRDYLLFRKWSEFGHEPLSHDASPESQKWWSELRVRLLTPVSVETLSSHCGQILSDVLDFKRSEKLAKRSLPKFLDLLADSLEFAIFQSNLVIQKIHHVHQMSQQMIRDMNFNLLYDPIHKLFSIGMRVRDHQLDPSYYDLLASEARLTSFVAIAKGDIPFSHWFHLNRSLVKVGRTAALVSWSGSMFEYLMPDLVMRSPEGGLLDDTCRHVVHRQINYGRENSRPWGISESAYNKRDLNLTYQYSNFGVPGLGLKRGLASDLVVAPYASILAALYEPAASAENLLKLRSKGAFGEFGFYEALDFTPIRVPEGRSYVVVKTYMAHHQGMALVALSNIFNEFSMQRRFHADPFILATELLLQERTPRALGVLPVTEEGEGPKLVKEPIEHVSRRYHSVNKFVPQTQLLSNGNYMTMITSAGAGFSRIHELAVTRWREDVTQDLYGVFFYIKDCESGKVWSAGHQPVCVEASTYEAVFSEDRVRIIREDNSIKSELEIFVSTEENAEIRQVTLTNLGFLSREIEVTSYSEVVINSHAADVAHPAFSNLFIETEFLSELSSLIASRRPRSLKDKQLWLMHGLRGDHHSLGGIQFETDRAQFIGRGRTTKNPFAIQGDHKLSGTTGPVLDPVMSLRTRVRLAPGESSKLSFSIGVADSREAAIVMAEKFGDPSIFERAGDLSWLQAQVKLHHLGIEPDEAHLFQRLLSRLIFQDSSLRPPSEILKRNSRNVTGLWAHGISGDHPIVLVRIDDFEGRNLVRQLLKAQIYCATKGFISDLVIMNERGTSYTQELQLDLESMAHAAHVPSGPSDCDRGKIFVLRGDLISEADHYMLASEARAILSTRDGSLSDQVKRTRVDMNIAPKVVKMDDFEISTLPFPPLDFFNGYGGFSKKENEYVVVLRNNQVTPAPWINVVANSEFGFQVSESGAGYTWASNSRENQMTPWSNDPICDPPGEALYIRDRNSGRLWSPTASPIRLSKTDYITHHGQGYSRFETLVHGIYSELTQFVMIDQPVKISSLLLENRSKRRRRLTVSNYCEWVLGFSRATMAPTTVTEFDDTCQAIFATNPRNSEHGHKVAFSAILQNQTSFTCDRTEFIGRNSSLSEPLALLQDDPLRNASGGGFDPCAALQTQFELKPGERIEITFFLGQASSRRGAQEMVRELRRTNFIHELSRVKDHWNELLGQIQVETPVPSFDIVINRWYLYQTIVCRLWARSAFYQAGGAYGFRDQLQDVMAVMMTSPKIAREHILRAAGRQFLEGDVQHWWHPPTGRGVRTKFSDDLLWLPYVVDHYLNVTQDFTILEEGIFFIEGTPLESQQEDSYDTPRMSQQQSSLYEHCARTIDRSLKTGVHGLPLMGGGDWNDGMNHVGIGGQGESVWLAWFLIANLKNFAPLALKRGEPHRSQVWTKHREELIESIEKNGWDGSWYRRAYFDDGTPLGSAENTECQIDSLAQTWAIISGAGNLDRAHTAMHSIYEHLVNLSDEIVLLFSPPFDRTPQDPGYIKGYLPGVRENGGQYTHAASWVVMATAILGQRNRAFELFSFLNPINHTANLARTNCYKIEPYVLAGDIYSNSPNAGRGGWSWYTGAAGWMYRAGVEYILGFQVAGNEVTIRPCVPLDWTKFKIIYRYGRSTYVFEIEIKAEITQADKKLESQKMTLADDGMTHRIVLIF